MTRGLLESFAGLPDGPFVAADGWRTHRNSTPGAGFSVAGGRLVNGATEARPAAAYLLRDLDEPVTSLSARFVFLPGRFRLRDHGGVMVGAWGGDLTADWPNIPPSPCHLVITPTHWTYGVWDGGLRTAASGLFLRRLARDTVHEVAVELSGDTAALRLPDGAERTVRDPRIAVGARQACFELYQANAAKDSRAALVEVGVG